ncbi:alpha/beta hydrolase [Pseudactinotalea suaedae]|uniref:alpha/beta hydrolase n=1 Tax=Pseudactinotalea suaedae TaxID=1524924 RepID=UPI0013908471|nr:alpha/beta hydrolase [Pseudactinotalea suaedae]
MRTIDYGPLPEHRADVHLPESPDAAVLVYFHGGGLEIGERGDNPGLFEHLVGAGVGVISANYRLYPGARYPEFVEDAALCVAWVLEHFPGRPILVGGSSAGAYLAMMLRFDPRWLSAQGIASDAVVGWVFDAGQPTTHLNVLRERGLDTRRVVVDEAAPLFHIGPGTAAAPTLVLLAGDDIPGRREQTDLMLATLRTYGADDGVRTVVLDGHQHCEYLGTEAGQARLAQLVAELAGRS